MKNKLVIAAFCLAVAGLGFSCNETSIFDACTMSGGKVVSENGTDYCVCGTQNTVQCRAGLICGLDGMCANPDGSKLDTNECTQAEKGNVFCEYMTSENSGPVAVLRTCNGKNYVISASCEDTNQCNADYTGCAEKTTIQPTNPCTENGVKKCIVASDKAYLATCDGTEYKYTETDVCASNQCNADFTDCVVETNTNPLACDTADAVKCIEVENKAYKATCDGTEYKYTETDVCASNQCNADFTDCAAED